MHIYDHIILNSIFSICNVEQADEFGKYKQLLDDICSNVSNLKENNNIKLILKDLDRDISIPEDASLRMSYKQKRDIEKLEFKIYWPQRKEYKIDANQK